MICKTSWKFPLIAIAALAVAGCGGASGGNGSTDPVAELLFSPTNGAVPSPNDLGFTGSEDGTLNVTEVTPTGDSSPLDSQVSINSTDGFSTLASATAKFTVAVDPDTVVPGATVRVFAVDTLGDPNTVNLPADPAGPKPPTRGGTTTELTAGTDFVASLSAADPNGTTLAVTPLRPLAPDQTYMVVVTTGIESRNGGAIGASEQYELAKSSTPLVDGSGTSQVEGLSDADAATLEGVRQLVAGVDVDTDGTLDGGQIPVIEDNTSLAADDVILSWTFTTQTIGNSLAAVRSAILGDMTAAAFVDATQTPGALTDTNVDTQPNSSASVYAGALAGVPYFLEPGDVDPTNVLTGFWTRAGDDQLTPADPEPTANSAENVPVLVTIPNGTAPAGGWPVVIFQHGITSNRTALLGIADSLAQAGLAAVAIDLPLHGIVFQQEDDPCAADPTSTECFVFNLWQGDGERHFGVDLVSNDSGDAGADGLVDSSGTHFVNLSSLRTSRDNLRQSVSDLFVLREAIAAIDGVDLDASAAGDQALNASSISFLGHSLGGIVGTAFTANEPNVGAAVFAMAGGGIAKLLDGSPTIGPDIAEGLAANNLVKGLSGYEQFLGAAQTVIDSGDPANHAAVAAMNHNTLLLEVIGGNSSSPDQVVPNNVVKPFQQGVPEGTIESPTAGTDPLASILGATQIATSFGPQPPIGGSPLPGDYLIRYTAGDHASPLLPDASVEATTEMQTNIASFLASGGTGVTFAGSGTVAAP